MNQPGAAHERTVLAWRRTLVSVTVVALLLGRLAAIELPMDEAAVVLAATAVVWSAFVLLTGRRSARVATPIGRTLPVMVALVLLYCAMGTLLLVS
ncbi:DUF202 domain-containing protein [Dactylosporangium sp. AC04546]|uniref:DUF202 domain-containing protein n=1 Tax=Dactylosporangium sp. AC04546 TaxID=2862460 RepID=UPI001EDEA578|nr:DUF202 domain-containing protein [Dactylosporangium sp. AC04546]WVK85140.1 DUF202 domain-containing protein [Dactylosporangium sp. AC04546]